MIRRNNRNKKSSKNTQNKTNRSYRRLSKKDNSKLETIPSKSDEIINPIHDIYPTRNHSIYSANMKNERDKKLEVGQKVDLSENKSLIISHSLQDSLASHSISCNISICDKIADIFCEEIKIEIKIEKFLVFIDDLDIKSQITVEILLDLIQIGLYVKNNEIIDLKQIILDIEFEDYLPIPWLDELKEYVLNKDIDPISWLNQSINNFTTNQRS